MNTCCLVVWYFPRPEDVGRTKLLARQHELVIVIDNTDGKAAMKNPQINGIKYFSFGENMGIAHAQNFGFEIAIQNGYTHVITMDQDSAICDKSLDTLREKAKALFCKHDVGIVAVSQRERGDAFDISEVAQVMSSGSIISTRCWKEVGGFDDALFIDQVDHDFCMRIRLAGYRIFEVHGAKMEHQLGYPVEKRLFGKLYRSNGYSQDRVYYYFRNKLVFAKRYGGNINDVRRYLARRIFLILLVEKGRLPKLVAAIEAFRDVSRGRLGKRPRKW